MKAVNNSKLNVLRVPFQDGIEDDVIDMLRPLFNHICSNEVRACILHLLLKAKHLNYTMQVEEIAHKLGKRHSVIIYHLEQLKDWKLVDVIRKSNYGSKERRSIWGLNLTYPNLIQEVYTFIVKYFYTQKELDEMSSVNKNVRSN